MVKMLDIAACDHDKYEYFAADGEKILVFEICDECDTINCVDRVEFAWREK